MAGQINVEIMPVGRFLAGQRQLTLPWFQRSYAWGERQIGRLFADLTNAMEREPDRRRYFLGHVYLARGRDAAPDELIDGNQRITTLTIVFSILRDMAKQPEAAELHQFVSLAAGATPGLGSRLRLNPQPSVAAFLERYVQSPGATNLECEEDVMSLSQTERCIFNNREDLKRLIGEMGFDRRRSFAEFLANQCSLTISTVETADEGWDILATEEQTGLRHHDNDRMKYSLLAPIPRQDQALATRVWDTWQGRLGSDRMQELLSHIRTLRLQRRSTKPIEEDLIRIFRLDRSGLQFLETELTPRARILHRLILRDIGTSEAEREKIGRSLVTLEWLDHALWIAPALKWFELRGEDDPETGEFFRLLDRLGWLLRISGTDPVAQERRFIEVIEDLQASAPLARCRSLTADDRVLPSALSNLRSRTFEAKRYSDLVLRRISFELGRDPGPLEPDTVTIEHVLPRNPLAGSKWWEFFRSKSVVGDYANRLGNLAFLTRAENQMASTKDYEEKRGILRASPFLLAREASLESDWTQDVIRRRTERLINVLLEAWGLPRAR